MEGSEAENQQILEAYQRSLDEGRDQSITLRGCMKKSSTHNSRSLTTEKHRHAKRDQVDSSDSHAKNKVHFSEDAHPGIEVELALSITRHRIKDGRYIEYTIVVHQKGRGNIYPIQKRYKNFETLQRHMKRENKDYELPHLPGKRWFKANKWDDNYHIDRRFALQLYLRLLVKFYGKSSPVLCKFLDLKEDRELLDYNVPTKSERIILENMNNTNTVNSVSHQAQKLDADAAAVLKGVDLPPPPSSILQASSGNTKKFEYSAHSTTFPQSPTRRDNFSSSGVETTDIGITGDPWDETNRDEGTQAKLLVQGSASEAGKSVMSVPPGSAADTSSGSIRDHRVTSMPSIPIPSDSDSDRELEFGRERACSSIIAIKRNSDGDRDRDFEEESDYLKDSIASSFQLREMRMSISGLGKDEAENENIIAANLNLHLLNSAKQAESPFYSKAEQEYASERALSLEFFPGTAPSETMGAPSYSSHTAKNEDQGSKTSGGSFVEDTDSDSGISDGGWVDDFGKLGVLS